MNVQILAPALPAPGAPSIADHAGDADAAGFADCLDEARADPPAVPVTKPKPTGKGKAPAESDPRAAAPAAPVAPALDAPPCEVTACEAKAPLPSPKTSDTPAEDTPPPDLSVLLPGWAPAASSAAEGASAAKKGFSTASASDAPRSAAAQPVLEAAPAGTPRRDAAHGDEAPLSNSPTHAETARSRATPEAMPRSIDAPAALPAPTPAPPAAASTTALPSTPTATLAPSPHQADFAPALAAQVRWWADAGVQQAQLTLNPPEMGPVTVRILVNDAREARIDFAADLAATRSAIEGALPVLAAALDESGLKLAGGGVHDARERQDAWQHARAQSARSTPASHAEARVNEHTPPARAGAARGIVDLVA